MKKTDSVKMSKRAFAKEHKELLGVLKHPTKSGLKREVREQSSEVKRITGRKKP